MLRTGRPSSLQRSYTPAPSPMMSIRISLGLRSYGVASYSALIFPTVAMRSTAFQLFTGSSSLFFCRLAGIDPGRVVTIKRVLVDPPDLPAEELPESTEPSPVSAILQATAGHTAARYR